MPSDRKPTLRERAIRYGRWTVAVTPKIAAFKGYEAGWHARGRANRLTKAEREVVEAAKIFARTPSSYGLEQELLQAVSALSEIERARKGGK